MLWNRFKNHFKRNEEKAGQKTESAGLTDVGLRRSHNEDAFFLSDKAGLYLVADGMGGHSFGEVDQAAHIEVNHLRLRIDLLKNDHRLACDRREKMALHVGQAGHLLREADLHRRGRRILLSRIGHRDNIEAGKPPLAGPIADLNRPGKIVVMTFLLDLFRDLDRCSPPKVERCRPGGVNAECDEEYKKKGKDNLDKPAESI